MPSKGLSDSSKMRYYCKRMANCHNLLHVSSFCYGIYINCYGYSLRNYILLLYKEFYLFQKINKAAGHLIKTPLLWNCTHFRHPILWLVSAFRCFQKCKEGKETSKLTFQALATPDSARQFLQKSVFHLFSQASIDYRLRPLDLKN